MPIADPFEHRATRNARQPALRLCIEACPLIYDPLHYLDFKDPEVGILGNKSGISVLKENFVKIVESRRRTRCRA